MRAAVVAGLVLAVGTAAAQSNDAERLYTEGQKAYDDKRYDDALTAWEKSYELSRLPGLVFNIAQAHRLRGDCTKAVESYKKFIELDPSSSQRPAAEGLIKELEPCKDAPAVVERHDVTPPRPPPPRVIEPPKHDGAVVDHVEVDRGHGMRVAGVIVGIAGLGVISTGVVFGNRASSLATEVHDACSMGCAWADVQSKDADGRSAALTQWILYGAGAAALVTSGVLYYIGARAHTSVTVTPHASGAAVSLLGSW
jgi:tetratricopeptide (TPR) repeat protein